MPNTERDELKDNKAQTINPTDFPENTVESEEEEDETFEFLGYDIPYKALKPFFLGAVFETWGSFFFFLACLMATTPLNACLVLWIVITLFAPYGGGTHVNPIVTFGVYVYERKYIEGLPKLLLWTGGQMLAATAVMWFANGIKSHDEIEMFKEDVDYKEFMLESFYSGTYVYFCLFSTTPITKPSESRALNFVLLSAWLLYAFTAASTESIGAISPSVVFMVAWFNNIHIDGYYEQYKSDIWMIVLSQYVGALVFALIFLLTEWFHPDKEKIEKQIELQKELDKEKEKEEKRQKRLEKIKATQLEQENVNVHEEKEKEPEKEKENERVLVTEE